MFYGTWLNAADVLYPPSGTAYDFLEASIVDAQPPSARDVADAVDHVLRPHVFQLATNQQSHPAEEPCYDR